MNVIARGARGIGGFETPVLTQEMRIRQRGAKPFWVLLVYVLVLSIAALITYEQTVGARLGSLQGHDLSGMGRNLFYVISIVQLGLAVLVVPAFSSSSITSERERGTFDLLSLTLLASGSIVRQKLLAAIAQVLLMIVASLPVVGVTFLLGGVSPMEIVVVYLILISTAVLLSAIGMLSSCCVRNSRTSTFLAYLVPLAAFAGVPLCCSWLAGVGQVGFDKAMGSNPVMFALMFALTGAIPAFVVYGVASLFLGIKWGWWRTRVCRIALFGLIYAALLFVMSNPNLVDSMIQRSSFNAIEILNPFTALKQYVLYDANAAGNTTVGYSPNVAYYLPWMVWLAIAFAFGMSYILERISCFRLNGLRRA